MLNLEAAKSKEMNGYAPEACGRVVPYEVGGERCSRASRWSKEETVTLVIVKREYEEEHAVACNRDLKWVQISKMCGARGVLRSSSQCKKRWQDTVTSYRKVKDWERRSGRDSYWMMSAAEKKLYELPTMFEKEIFDEFGRSIENKTAVSLEVADSDLAENSPLLQDVTEEHQLQNGTEFAKRKRAPWPSPEKKRKLPEYLSEEVEHWTKIMMENTEALESSREQSNCLIEKQTQIVVSSLEEINTTMKCLIEKLCHSL